MYACLFVTMDIGLGLKKPILYHSFLNILTDFRKAIVCIIILLIDLINKLYLVYMYNLQ